MREILFRAKCIDNGEWVYGVPIKKALVGSHDGYYPKIIPECDGRHQTVYSTAIKEETIGQYTGLKDVHGTRIFEGDVVKVYDVYCNETVVGVVEFCDGSFRIYDKDFTSYDRWMYCKVEVIGNVFDNSLECYRME